MIFHSLGSLFMCKMDMDRFIEVKEWQHVTESNERIDYITKNLQIVQSEDVFSFSMDAVLLARFAWVPITRGSIVDLCSGNGVIPLVLSTRSRVPITGVEIQPRLKDMADRSIQLNNLSAQIQCIEADVRETTVPIAQADLVTCNPPYFAATGETEYHNNPHFDAARHERNGTLQDIVKAASRMVKQKGKVAMVLRPERFLELVHLYQQYGIEPKRAKWIHPLADRPANILLLEGIKAGRPGLTIEPPLIVYDDQRQYTKEFRNYYEGSD